MREALLTPSNVTASSFGKIGSFPVDGQIYAQPLCVTGVPIPGVGIGNIIYAATMHNSVYAIDADAPTSIMPLWRVNLGPSVPSSVLGLAFLNEDGSANSDAVPAKPGSVVALLATGIGQIGPGSQEGMLPQGQTLPAALLPIAVLIDGQPADVLYAGAAPGMLEGFAQVNIRIPANLANSGDLNVVLKAGDYTSPNTVTVSVAP